MKWNRHLVRTYSTSLFSEANVFCVLIYYLALAIPFYLSFGTQNFWMKENVDVYPTSFTYSGEYVASVTYINSNSVVTASLSNVPALVDQGFKDSNIALTIDGVASTGKNTFSGSITSTLAVTGIEIYLFFTTEVSGLKRSFIATSAISIDFSGGNSAQIVGSLNLNQAAPITLFSGQSTSVQPPYIYNQEYLKDLPSIISNIRRNHQLSTSYVTISSSSTDISFKMSLFSQGVSQIRYYPSFTQTLRNAFSQYFSLLVVTLFLVKLFVEYLATHKVFPLQIQQKEFKLHSGEQR